MRAGRERQRHRRIDLIPRSGGQEQCAGKSATVVTIPDISTCWRLLRWSLESLRLGDFLKAGPTRPTPRPSSSPAKAFAGEARQVPSTATVHASNASSAKTMESLWAGWIPAGEAGGDAAGLAEAEIRPMGRRQRALNRQRAA